ncbi:MAG: iron-containing alcohol dehydrogenase [Clostridiales bacterium]|nr:iron-containing alcohol dehydrogenase [Clostridiales bacterium]
MAGTMNFIKSTDRDGVTPQTLYIDAGSAGAIAETLKERGSKRLLILSNKSTLEYRAVEDTIRQYNEAGLRTFNYQRRNIVSDSRDIDGALKTYREYNCDTIIVIGSREDISVGKLTALAVTNPGKFTDLAGVGNVKFDIKTLVAIPVDSTASASTPESTFYDHETSSWNLCISQIMLPHMVVIDSDMLLRNANDSLALPALDALCMAIEAYLSPLGIKYPSYKADATVAIYKILGRLNRLMADNIDAYLQTKVAVGGFYAGLSTTRLGFGYTYFIMHKLQERAGCDYGFGMGKVLVAILRSLLEYKAQDMAELARLMHFCTPSLDTISAAQSFIDSVNDIFTKNTPPEKMLMLNPGDRSAIAEGAIKSMHEMGFETKISADTIENILRLI